VIDFLEKKIMNLEKNQLESGRGHNGTKIT
jgi:hypothetical protein